MKVGRRRSPLRHRRWSPLPRDTRCLHCRDEGSLPLNTFYRAFACVSFSIRRKRLGAAPAK
jgi:hypothetical protein